MKAFSGKYNKKYDQSAFKQKLNTIYKTAAYDMKLKKNQEGTSVLKFINQNMDFFQ